MTRELMTLRPYQREAIDAVTDAWREGTRRPAVVLPTGMGKTVVFSHLVAERHAATGERSVVLVHRDELADQAVGKLRAVAPHLLVGKVKATRDEVHADLVVASVPTLASYTRLGRLLDSQGRFGRLGLWVTDECHHAISPSYGRVYAATRDADHVGFTATLKRSDNKGLGSVWDDVVSSKTIAYAVKNGFLVRPVGRSVKVPELDLTEVGNNRKGDYAEGALGDALEDSKALEIAADAYLEHAASRPGIAFTPTVATAQHLAVLLTQRGIPAAVVHGGTPRTERLAIYEAFRTGSIRVLCNCMVLTEGFDAPWASAALIVRPTQSNPLYIQMVGRVLRPFPGKADALVIDVVGASLQNKLQTLIDLEEGLWKQATACEECLCLPCECICEECGKPKKPKCECPSMWVPPVLQAAGTGAALDLFASSESAWGQTPGGVWFIGCGPAGYVFLWPNAGTWDVCVAPLRNGTALQFQRTDYRAMPIEAAMTWAEAEAEDVGAVLARKSARWRKSPATDAQANLAHRYGIVVPAGATKGDVSDLIDNAKAAGIFDRYVGASL